MPARLKRLLVGLGAAVLLMVAAAATSQLVMELRALQQLQLQRAELQDVKYGLLNAEVWVAQISTILAERIERFELTDQNRPQLKRNLERLLDRMLVEVEQVLRRRNAQGENWIDRLQGSLRQGVQDWLLDFDQLRARVPVYADAVLDELDRPETRQEIERQLRLAIEQASEATFTRVDRSMLQQIKRAHGCESIAICKGQLTELAHGYQTRARAHALWTLGSLGLLFVLAWLAPNSSAIPSQTRLSQGARGRSDTTARRPSSPCGQDGSRCRELTPELMLMLTAGTLILLAAGVMTPMIEVEARIDELSLSLLGSPVLFTDQVLYFQSKSILDLVQVLIATRAPDMILVAVLVVLFSLIFPAAKMLASLLYYSDMNGLRRHVLVQFFALRSGKWSMADVLVVAILMAYVGFDGLISSQLAGLAGAATQVELISTNGTSLQLGFFLFLAFVLASLALSTLLEARAPESTRPS
jgi:hypothetical protein